MSHPNEQEEDVLWGNAAVIGGNIPLESLLTYLNNGLTVDEFCEDFPGVDRDEVLARLRTMRGD